ncbi:MAG TPA: MotA/TolQ/ExbB proton channel family protein [Terracidiphilus sp.]|nr:MotA/TolQ/ExbB proton channel family protein [Terracidiphilus sp.]
MPIFTLVAFAFLLQSEPAATPPDGGIAHGMNGLMDLMSQLSGVAIGVLIVLLIASLYSWTVILGKWSTFRKATKESRRFIRMFRKATRFQEISSVIGEYKDSPLAVVFEDVYETYRRQTGGAGPPRNLGPLERSAQTAASEAVTMLERRMTWLATIAATSPFVGLFGTVMGVVEAFHGLGAAGSATLRAVAPGMADALITTAAGLFVAVPAVVAYNQLNARIRVFASAIDDFARELLNSMEEIQVRMPSAAAATGQMPRSLSEAGRELPSRG